MGREEEEAGEDKDGCTCRQTDQFTVRLMQYGTGNRLRGCFSICFPGWWLEESIIRTLAAGAERESVLRAGGH